MKKTLPRTAAPPLGRQFVGAALKENTLLPLALHSRIKGGLYEMVTEFYLVEKWKEEKNSV